MSDGEKAELEFHFYGRPAAEHSVPVSIMTHVLEAAQKAMHLLGMQIEGREVKERFRVPSEIERKYVLRVTVPKEGSLTIPVELGDPSSDLFAANDIEAAAQKFGQFSSLLAGHQPDDLRTIVPDSPIRRRLLEAYRSMTPPPGSGWKMYIQGTGVDRVEFDDKLTHRVGALLRADTPDEDRIESQTVTGKLLRIDFAEHKLTVQHPQTNRALECFYEPELEELLFENRRDFIQVTGKVILDAEGNPEKIIGVTDITDLDTSPIEIGDVAYGGGRLEIHPPLVLTPESTESFQYLKAEVEDFDIYLMAPTREALVQDLQNEIRFLWDEYVKASESELVDAAVELRRVLRSRISEVAE